MRINKRIFFRAGGIKGLNKGQGLTPCRKERAKPTGFTQIPPSSGGQRPPLPPTL